MARSEIDKETLTKALIEEQYRSFKGIPLIKPFEYYEQCIKHPRDEKTYVTVESMKHVPKIDLSDSSSSRNNRTEDSKADRESVGVNPYYI